MTDKEKTADASEVARTSKTLEDPYMSLLELDVAKMRENMERAKRAIFLTFFGTDNEEEAKKEAAAMLKENDILEKTGASQDTPKNKAFTAPYQIVKTLLQPADWDAIAEAMAKYTEQSGRDIDQLTTPEKLYCVFIAKDQAKAQESQPKKPEGVLAKPVKQIVSPADKFTKSIPFMPSLYKDREHEDDYERIPMVKDKPDVALFARLLQVPINSNGERYLAGYLKPEDLNTYKAIGSLWAAGNKVITDAQIWRTQNGKTHSETPSTQQKNKIHSSVINLMSTIVEIDLEQMQKSGYKLAPNSPLKYGQHMLIAKYQEDIINGARTMTYYIQEKPVLYEFAEALKQLQRFPIEWMDIRDTKTNNNGEIELLNSGPATTNERTSLKFNINERINTMINRGKKRKYLLKSEATIRWDTIIRQIEQTTASRKKKLDIKEFGQQILNNLIARGVIESFENVNGSRGSLEKTIIHIKGIPLSNSKKEK